MFFTSQVLEPSQNHQRCDSEQGHNKEMKEESHFWGKIADEAYYDFFYELDWFGECDHSTIACLVVSGGSIPVTERWHFSS